MRPKKGLLEKGGGNLWVTSLRREDPFHSFSKKNGGSGETRKNFSENLSGYQINLKGRIKSLTKHLGVVL